MFTLSFKFACINYLYFEIAISSISKIHVLTQYLPDRPPLLAWNRYTAVWVRRSAAVAVMPYAWSCKTKGLRGVLRCALNSRSFNGERARADRVNLFIRRNWVAGARYSRARACFNVFNERERLVKGTRACIREFFLRENHFTTMKRNWHVENY